MIDELVSLLVRNHQGVVEWYEVRELLQRIAWLYEDSIVASEVIGMFTPWQPEQPPLVQALSIGAMFDKFFGPPEKPKGDRWRWPQLQKAVDWLRSSAVVTYEQLEGIVKKARSSVFVSGTLTDPVVIEEVRGAVAESMDKGMSLQQFRERVDEIVSLPKAETETIFRTNTKRAYLEGQEEILKNPAVRRVVKYMLFRATDDGRVRPFHWAMHNWIAEIDSPLHQLFLAMQSEYNCRCALIPVSERRLAGRRVYTIDEVPSEIRQHYGL